jgi:DNA mismatch endonuclease, patch repair protein
MDTVHPQIRSQIMRSVKGSNNKSTELALIRLFRQNKITGWRRHQKLFGHPDFYFPKFRIVLFVDGCFWHGCSCRKIKPASNKSYWTQKIKRNIARDKEVTKTLQNRGYPVIRIKECQLSKGRLPTTLVTKLHDART